MTQLFHIDGYLLVLTAALVLAAGQMWHCWRFRAPLFLLAFILAAQGLLQFGVGRGIVPHVWAWARIVEHACIVVVAVAYLIEQRAHGPQPGMTCKAHRKPEGGKHGLAH